MATGDIARVKIMQRLDGQSIMNVLHFQSIDAGATLASLGAMVDAWITSDLDSVQDADVTYEQLVIDSIRPVGPFLEMNITAASGALAGTAMPGVVTVTSTFRSDTRGRQFNGRAFWSGLITTDVAAGQLVGARQTAWQTVMDNLLAAAFTANWPLAVYSRIQGATATPPPESAAELVTSVTVKAIVSTQRRRGVGKGQ